MRVPLSWLREVAGLPADVSTPHVADRLTMLGLKLDVLHEVGVTGPLVVGQVTERVPETHRNGKTISWCRVDVGAEQNDAEGGRGIVCGAHNFDVGDLVIVALPGAVLPGDFVITARRTYGHVSDGMICSAHELGLGDDATGIVVLDPGEAKPGDDAAELLSLRDEVLELEITTDRGYALSIRGVAREAALGLDLPYADPVEAIEVPAAREAAWPVEVNDPAACPVFAALTVSGIDPAATSPRWLVRRVELAGMRSVSLVVDVTNYVMLELGQPIHAYDRDELDGTIVVRRAQAGETLRTLDDVERRLEPSDLLITDSRGPIGMAGVMGGAATEISDATTAVVIEAACFDAVTVSRTARGHRLLSEASKRFERGVDPALAPAAAARVAQLLVELAGARLEPGMTLVGTPPEPTGISVAGDLPARVSGLEIDGEATVAALVAVGCSVSPGEPLQVTPPSWRPDLGDPYDLVEEVTRVVGYERVPSVLPTAPPGRGLTTAQRLRRRIGHALAGAGFTEILTYPFIGPADLDRLGLPPDDPRRHALRVANPLSAEQPLLHTTLLPGLLAVLSRNVGRGHSSAALSLLGPVFVPGPGELPPAPLPGVDARPDDSVLAELDAALPAQPRHLALVLAGERSPAGWWGPARPVLWADAVEAVQVVAGAVHVPLTVATGALMPWHPGRCAELSLADAAGAVLGHAGELHPAVCVAYGLPPRTVAAELDLDALIAAAPPGVAAPRFSTQPVAKEDLALVVEESVPAADVAAAVRAGLGTLCESVRLFDVYRGDPVPPDHKSLAFALRLRAPDRTLTENDLTDLRARAVQAASAATGATLRS
jgi:phenylalanyl-tRNA synthetase beta chain